MNRSDLVEPAAVAAAMLLVVLALAWVRFEPGPSPAVAPEVARAPVLPWAPVGDEPARPAPLEDPPAPRAHPVLAPGEGHAYHPVFSRDGRPGHR